MPDDDPTPPEPVEAVAREAPAPEVGPAVEGVDSSLQRARLAEDRLGEVLAAYRELKAETEGHRERMARVLEQQFAQRRERFLSHFIDVLDSFDRALDAAFQAQSPTPMIDGIIMVRTRLLQTLREEGLERVPVLGLPYDPEVAEAVGTESVTEPDHHHLVVKEMLRGYRLSGRVIRHAQVMVGEYSEKDPALAETGPVDVGGLDEGAGDAKGEEPA